MTNKQTAKNLIDSYQEPDLTAQRDGCIQAIKELCDNDDTNQSEFLIYLRDFLLDYME